MVYSHWYADRSYRIIIYWSFFTAFFLLFNKSGYHLLYLTYYFFIGFALYMAALESGAFSIISNLLIFA